MQRTFSLRENAADGGYRKIKMKNKLEKSLKKKWVLRLKTKHPDRDNYDGGVLHLSKKIVIFLEQISFEFDGIQIFPLNFIKSIRDTNYEKCSNKIMSNNKQYKKISKNNIFKKTETIEDCLKILYKRKIWAVIETVENKESCLYVGPIEQGNNKYVFQRCYDATGKWEKTYEISLKNIVRVEINSKYLKHFNMYMKNKIP